MNTSPSARADFLYYIVQRFDFLPLLVGFLSFSSPPSAFRFLPAIGSVVFTLMTVAPPFASLDSATLQSAPLSLIAYL